MRRIDCEQQVPVPLWITLPGLRASLWRERVSCEAAKHCEPASRAARRASAKRHLKQPWGPGAAAVVVQGLQPGPPARHRLAGQSGATSRHCLLQTPGSAPLVGCFYVPPGAPQVCRCSPGLSMGGSGWRPFEPVVPAEWAVGTATSSPSVARVSDSVSFMETLLLRSRRLLGLGKREDRPRSTHKGSITD